MHESGGNGPDEGIELTLMLAGTRTLVQCKHWRSNKVGVPVVREHPGVMTAHSADHGVIVCSGEFSAPAIAIAVSNGIELKDGTALIYLVIKVQGDTLRANADAAPVAVTHPMCPRCNAPLLERVVKRGPRAGSAFPGCSHYPACRGTRDITGS